MTPFAWKQNAGPGSRTAQECCFGRKAATQWLPAPPVPALCENPDTRRSTPAIASPTCGSLWLEPGIAGLAAADAARCAWRVEVVVAEARDRLGGRIHTVPLGPEESISGVPGSTIRIGNPVTEALAAAGVQTSNDGAFGAPMAVWADGWVDSIGATTVAGVLQADWDPVQALAATGSDRFVDGVEWFIADRGLDGELGELARATLLSIVAPLVSAAPPDRVSLAGAAAYAEQGGGNLVPAGGYGALAEALAEGLDVRLGSAVSRIEHGRAGVSVVTDREVLEGDRAVVTLPLGVLRAGEWVLDPTPSRRSLRCGRATRDGNPREGRVSLRRAILARRPLGDQLPDRGPVLPCLVSTQPARGALHL